PREHTAGQLGHYELRAVAVPHVSRDHSNRSIQPGPSTATGRARPLTPRARAAPPAAPPPFSSFHRPAVGERAAEPVCCLPAPTPATDHLAPRRDGNNGRVDGQHARVRRTGGVPLDAAAPAPPEAQRRIFFRPGDAALVSRSAASSRLM